MYTVYYQEDFVCDYETCFRNYVVCFQGSLEECRAYVANDEDAEELSIVAPDGFTVVK